MGSGHVLTLIYTITSRRVTKIIHDLSIHIYSDLFIYLRLPTHTGGVLMTDEMRK